MVETYKVNLETWQDVLAHKTGNPLAEDEILLNAQQGSVLVTAGPTTYFPKLMGAGWTLYEVLPESSVPAYLSVPAHEARILLASTGLKPIGFRFTLFQQEPLFYVRDITAALERLSAEKGLTPSEAALELGLNDQSFQQISSEIPFNSKNRFLKEFLNAYVKQFLPDNKVWSSRSSLVREFVARHNTIKHLHLQVRDCDVDGCKHIASSQCINPSCRKGQPRRYICPAHEVWINQPGNLTKRPPSICPLCATLVQAGKLPFELL